MSTTTMNRGVATDIQVISMPTTAQDVEKHSEFSENLWLEFNQHSVGAVSDATNVGVYQCAVAAKRNAPSTIALKTANTVHGRAVRTGTSQRRG